MIKISIVVITLNEERNIGRCLESVKNIADEIIVIDSFSTDATKQICAQYNAKFTKRKWDGYTNTKNYANSLASSDYILSLDADEALSPTLEKSILAFKKNPTPNAVFSISRLTNYCGQWIKHGGWYPDKKIRLWKSGEAKWEGLIHEQLNYNKELKTIDLKGDLLHYSYYTIQEHIAQANKFSEMGAIDAVKKGRSMNTAKVILFPVWKFIKVYFIKAGFLDGYMGFVVCSISCYEAFLKYAKTKELIKNKHLNEQ